MLPKVNAWHLTECKTAEARFASQGLTLRALVNLLGPQNSAKQWLLEIAGGLGPKSWKTVQRLLPSLVDFQLIPGLAYTTEELA